MNKILNNFRFNRNENLDGSLDYESNNHSISRGAASSLLALPYKDQNRTLDYLPSQQST